jgi:hypothetical protein
MLSAQFWGPKLSALSIIETVEVFLILPYCALDQSTDIS